MTWFPIGPDFVGQPRLENFNRFSLRNFWGGQGRVDSIAFEPAAPPVVDDPGRIYVTVMDESGQCAAFRKNTDETYWKPISDDLRRVNTNVDPSAIAVNPHFANVIYLGTNRDAAVYVSTNRGDSWGMRNALPAGSGVVKILVDRRPPASVDQTILYAATHSGIYRSVNNGAVWTLLLSGDLWSFAMGVDSEATPHFYAGVNRQGIFYADTWPDSPASFSLLNGTTPGLPAYAVEPATDIANFDAILVDCCPSNPATAYAWVTRPLNSGPVTHQAETVAVYKTTAARSAWTVAAVAPTITYMGTTQAINPMQGFINFDFGVAPNSSGDGAHDILFFGNIGLQRSIDSGATWQVVRQFFHGDSQCIAFFPQGPVSMPTIPRLWFGNDGGIAVNQRLCDPAFDCQYNPVNADNEIEEIIPPDSPVFSNQNSGLQNNLIYVMTHAPESMAHTYIGNVDTGTAVHGGSMGWRGFGAADSFDLVATQASNGIQIASKAHGGSGRIIQSRVDQGGYQLFSGWTAHYDLHPDFRTWPTSNMVADSTGRILAGCKVTAEATTVTADTGPSNVPINIPVADISIFNVGDYLRIGTGVPIPYQIAMVNAIEGTSVRVSGLYRTYPVGTIIRIIRTAVTRTSLAGISTRISQHFDHDIVSLAISQGAVRHICMMVRIGGSFRFYRIAESLTDPGTPNWPEFSTGLTGSITSSMNVACMIAGNSGDVWVLLLRSIDIPSGPTTIHTPLLRLPDGATAWQGVPCTGLPTDAFPDGVPHPYGRLVEHPGEPGVMFASYGGRVYRIAPSPSIPGSFDWTNLSGELPGAFISDIWAGNVGAPGTPAIYLLRASTIGRGAWEKNITPGFSAPARWLYLRRHLLDKGWSRNLADGLVNPYAPANQVWHWEAVDIKVEAPLESGALRYFQSDPVPSGMNFSTPATLPGNLTNVEFDLLRDYAIASPVGLKFGSFARVHAQVQNRSYTPVNGVRIWALYTRFSGTLPMLNSTSDGAPEINFWAQFHSDGSIVSALGASTNWKQLAAPAVVNGLDVNHPGIGSFNWDIPMFSAGDEGHYCIAIFIHSEASPIGESVRHGIDEIVMDNPQVCHKNVQLAPPMMMMGAPMGTGSGSGTGGGSGFSPGSMGLMYFYNPLHDSASSEIEFDLSRLPKNLKLSVQFPRLPGRLYPAVAMTGVSLTHKAGFLASVRYLFSSLADSVIRLFGGRKGKLPPLKPVYYQARGGGKMTLDGMKWGSDKFTGAKMMLVSEGEMAIGSAYNLYVYQKEKGKVVGGGTFIVRGPMNTKPIEPPHKSQEEFDEEEREMEENADTTMHPWLNYLRSHSNYKPT